MLELLKLELHIFSSMKTMQELFSENLLSNSERAYWTFLERFLLFVLISEPKIRSKKLGKNGKTVVANERQLTWNKSHECFKLCSCATNISKTERNYIFPLFQTEFRLAVIQFPTYFG